MRSSSRVSRAFLYSIAQKGILLLCLYKPWVVRYLSSPIYELNATCSAGFMIIGWEVQYVYQECNTVEFEFCDFIIYLRKDIWCHIRPYSFLCFQIITSDIRTRKVGCKPGDCRWPLKYFSGICVSILGVSICMGG